MQSAEDVALTFADGWPMSDGALTALTDLIRERDAQVRDAERAKVLAGFNPGRFLSRIPDSATVRVTRDAGGGAPSDPGGTVTITAEWTDDEEGR